LLAFRSNGVVAGYVTDYELPSTGTTTGSHNFTFVTVREAGHMVPQYQVVIG
jgi:carboxypeptidase C (cathepsin A)